MLAVSELVHPFGSAYPVRPSRRTSLAIPRIAFERVQFVAHVGERYLWHDWPLPPHPPRLSSARVRSLTRSLQVMAIVLKFPPRGF